MPAWWHTFHSKPEYFRAHVKQRARERYGVTLTTCHQREICDLIRAGQATLVRQASFDRSVWDVVWNDTTIRFAYSKRHQSLITALPLHEDDNHHTPV